VLYFGQFIPFVAAEIAKISNYWHGKSEMPSKEQHVKDWSRVMELVRKNVTINHFDPSLQTFVGLDWSETGEFYIMFQVLEKPDGNVSVHIVWGACKFDQSCTRVGVRFGTLYQQTGIFDGL
jgi:hypothetical protein